MKKLYLHIVRLYLSIGLFFYFRRIKVVGAHNIPKNEPVLLLANHQNGLLDPLIIAVKCGRLSYYLTRAGVFKKQITTRILKSLQMIPVYRIRDGWSNLSNNNAVFKECAQLLKANEMVVIFPEGSHNIVRTVRPLSKGFTRIIFETLDTYPDTNLKLLPAGLNYKKPEGFPDSVSLYIGNVLDAKSMIDNDKNESVNRLKQTIHKEITQLTTHIHPTDYNTTLRNLEGINANFLDPTAVNMCIESNFTSCDSVHVNKQLDVIRKLFRFLTICNLFLPYAVWKRFVKPKINEIEFLSTFRFAIAITLVPLWIILVCLLLLFLLGWTYALGYLLLTLCLILLTVKI